MSATGTVRRLSAGGTNEIAVFRINEETGEPSLIQNVDYARLHAADLCASTPAGRLLVVGNQSSVSVREGDSTTMVPANLAVFRVGDDGTLAFVQRHDVAVARKPLWWMGLWRAPLTPAWVAPRGSRLDMIGRCPTTDADS